MKRDPYPLQWPDGWKRTTARYHIVFNLRAVGSNTAAPPPVVRDWREVFAINGIASELAPVELLAVVKARYRIAIRDAHPDAGGSHERAAELNAALAQAESDLGGNDG